MDKQRVRRTKRAVRKGGDLRARTVARADAARVVGGQIKQAQTPKTLSVELMFDT